MSKTIRFLSSARLAAVLIAVLIVMVVLAFWIPQEALFPEEQYQEWVDANPTLAYLTDILRLKELFTSEPFYALAALLALNLAVCTWRRVARRVRNHRVTWGFAGSVIMHAAFVLLMVGAVVSGRTTFSGEMVLTEDQAVPDAADSYVVVGAVPRSGSAFGDFTVGLEDVDVTYEDGVIVDSFVDLVVVEDGESRIERGRVNYPVRVQGKSFRLLDVGYSVAITVTEGDDAPLFDAFVALGETAAEGDFDSIETGDLTLGLLAVPDIGTPLGDAASDPLDPRDPGVWVTPSVVGSTGEPTPLRVGESLDFEGFSVEVYDVRMWHSFLVRADGGLPVVYAAFVLVLVGMSMRLADPRERRMRRTDDA